MATVQPKNTTLTHVIAAMRAVGLPPRPVGAVDFSTRDYELSHGRRPGGFGSWAFEVPAAHAEIAVSKIREAIDALNNQPGLVGRASVEVVDGKVRVWMPCGTYGEAKAGAARLFAAFGSVELEVCT